MQFPSVTGSNLQRRELDLPEGFEGDLNLVLIAFQQWQQRQVNTWIPFAKKLEEVHPALRYYEMPTIQRLNALARTFINEGIRAGIPDPVACQRTITLYVDKHAFKWALHLPREDDIHVFLLNRKGRVLWRAEGILTRAKGESLVAAVQGGDHDEAE